MNDTQGSKLFWIQAEADMGKSAFASLLVYSLAHEDKLAGAFFCRFGDTTISQGLNLLKSLAYQIALNIESTREMILKASEELMKPETVFVHLILKPLKSLSLSSSNQYILVIDALDEIRSSEKDRIPIVFICVRI